MSWFEALILGLVQGLTEFLPVSSSGHLEIGKVLLDIEAKKDISFSIAVHGATVLSIVVVFFSDIRKLAVDFLKFERNESTIYISKIFVSIIPIGVVGIFFKDYVESFFTGNMVLVGAMLLVTAILLALTVIVKKNNNDIGYKEAIIMGIAQVFTVLPGISRSGATIATGLLMGGEKEQVTRFSFLMVIIPILGASFLDIVTKPEATEIVIEPIPLMIGFVAAFLSGIFACKTLIGIVKKGRVYYFAFYCALIGLITIFSL